MANALTDQHSAYLRSAAHQPVHWLPWGDAAFAAARAADKPILLDIGAVWCHWCHVMDGESYEDSAVAEVLNEAFVCIKVDRDERPDVDTRYQRAVAALTGQGGWPLTAFLTPDGEVFFGGTYFPPEGNRYGRPGFTTVLRQVARLYREQREQVTRSARTIGEHVVQALNEGQPGTPDPTLLRGAADQMARGFDVRYGGFGTAPKFPHPGAVQFLVARWHDERVQWQREIVEKTLTGMALGGIRDHLGGGFHRYAVDERWVVPHFEKMAYDNSELLRAYLDGWAALGTPLFRDVATGIVDWTLEVLSQRDPPAFFASQDADVAPGDDGDYWTWTPEEARAALDAEEFALVERLLDINEAGEMHHNPRKNVLWYPRPPTSDEQRELNDVWSKLKRARDRRDPPFVDQTAYVNWNALMAGAFLQAGAALDRPECNTLALDVLERLWREAWRSERGMAHRLGLPEPAGMLDDTVQSAAAFVDAYESTGAGAWLERAEELMEHACRAHRDGEHGGLWDLPAGPGGTAYLAHRAKPIQDAPTPSPNGVAALTLARLWAVTDAPKWRRALDEQLAAFSGAGADLGLYGATLFRAIDWGVAPVTRIEITGPPDAGPACDMHHLALSTYRPRKIVVRKSGERPAATVCVGTTCSLPVFTPDALRALLE